MDLSIATWPLSRPFVFPTIPKSPKNAALQPIGFAIARILDQKWGGRIKRRSTIEHSGLRLAPDFGRLLIETAWLVIKFQIPTIRARNLGTGHDFSDFRCTNKCIANIQVSAHVPIRTHFDSKLWPILTASLFCTVMSTVSLAQSAASSPADPTGEWLVANRVARIKIADCSGHLWGVVAWEARPGVDKKNPDPNLRTRPTLGMPVLMDMTSTKPNKWEGQVYNSENGHTYSASISLSDANTLRIQGCVFGFLCGGENWTRVETTATVGRAPAQAPATPPSAPAKTAAGKKTAAAQPATPPSDEVCSRVLGASGLSHERGLK